MRAILVAVLLFVGTAQADTVSDLVSLGMHPELAELVASLSTTKTNAAWFKARNQANDADINVLRVDATDDTQLNADSGDLIKLSVAATPVAALGAATPAAAFTPLAVADWVLNGRITSSGAFYGDGIMVGTPISGKTPAAGNVSIGGTLDVSGNTGLGGNVTLAAAKQVQQLPAILTPATDNYYGWFWVGYGEFECVIENSFAAADVLYTTANAGIPGTDSSSFQLDGFKSIDAGVTSTRVTCFAAGRLTAGVAECAD